MLKKIILSAVIASFLAGTTGCMSEPVAQNKPEPKPKLKGLARRFPERIPPFTLQSVTENSGGNDAQASYKPEKNEHVYSIVIIKEHSSTKEAESKVRKSLERYSPASTIEINGLQALSVMTKNPDLTCCLGIAKDCYTIEIDTHFTFGHQGNEDELVILTRNLAAGILNEWQ